MPHRRGHKAMKGIRRGTGRGRTYKAGGRVKKLAHGGYHGTNGTISGQGPRRNPTPAQDNAKMPTRRGAGRPGQKPPVGPGVSKFRKRPISRPSRPRNAIPRPPGPGLPPPPDGLRGGSGGSGGSGTNTPQWQKRRRHKRRKKTRRPQRGK